MVAILPQPHWFNSETDWVTTLTANNQHSDTYRQISNIRRMMVGNKIADHLDVVGASPVGAAPTTSSFLTYHLASIYCKKTTARWDEKHLGFGIWCILY